MADMSRRASLELEAEEIGAACGKNASVFTTLAGKKSVFDPGFRITVAVETKERAKEAKLEENPAQIQ